MEFHSPRLKKLLHFRTALSVLRYYKKPTLKKFLLFFQKTVFSYISRKGTF